MRRKRFFYIGQSTAEYAVLVAIVAAGIIAMQMYLKRGAQGRIKDLADQISSEQYEPAGTESTSSVTQKSTVTEKYLPRGKSDVIQTENMTRTSAQKVEPKYDEQQ